MNRFASTGDTTPPTQLATSASRSRWVTGGWSVAGDGRACAGRAGRGGAAGVSARGGAGRDPGCGNGRDRAGRLGPADLGVAGGLGCQHGADHRVVDGPVAGGWAGAVTAVICFLGVSGPLDDIVGCTLMSCLGWVSITAGPAGRSTRPVSTRPLNWPR